MGPFPFRRLAPFASSFDNPFLSLPSCVPFASSATGYSLTRYHGDTTGRDVHLHPTLEVDGPGDDGWLRGQGLEFRNYLLVLLIRDFCSPYFKQSRPFNS